MTNISSAMWVPSDTACKQWRDDDDAIDESGCCVTLQSAQATYI